MQNRLTIKRFLRNKCELPHNPSLSKIFSAICVAPMAHRQAPTHLCVSEDIVDRNDDDDPLLICGLAQRWRRPHRPRAREVSPTRARQLPRRQLVSSRWLRIARVPQRNVSTYTVKKTVTKKKQFQSELVHTWLDTCMLMSLGMRKASNAQTRRSSQPH